MENLHYTTERWVAAEIEFEANVIVENFDDAILDVIFTNRETGTTLVMPAFWDGGFSWKVRFAPTECGVWNFETKTGGKTEIGINGIKGAVTSVPYTGDLEIYKRGFVRPKENCRYFVYADGTPFFYLGDTHWRMALEEFDSAGDFAGDIKTDSHFKYIVDRRVEQRFTVYQSEPLSTKIDVSDGKISEQDIVHFKNLDRYYKYIAQKGLVHANAHLDFPSVVSNEGFRDNVEALSRYWVARYGAYPVMWTMGQEVDQGIDPKNPLLVPTYRRMMAETYRCDPYKSPLGAHQLNAFIITAKGGVPVAGVDYGSYLYDANDTKPTRVTIPSQYSDMDGFSWWANQWRPTVDRQYNFEIPKDYWENGNNLPIVDYEARYHIFSGGDFDARAQAWIAYLCGMGHGYGCSGMWAYKDKYSLGKDAFDGIEVIPAKVREETGWAELIDAPISSELGYIRAFMEETNWWRLTPDCDYGNAFRRNADGRSFFVASHDGNDVYAVYLYNRTTDSDGKLVNMDKNATYVAQWFDTRTGKYTLINEDLKADANGEYDIPEKPVADDMVLIVKKK